MGFLHIVIVLCIVIVEADKGNRRIKREDEQVIQSNVGETILLPCSVAKRDSITLPEWFKEGERIKSGAWDRYIVNIRGLKISNIIPTDEGLFTCQILDGFGFTSEIKMRLRVLDSPHRRIPSSWELSEESTPMPKGTKPAIKSSPLLRHVIMSTGSETVLRCDATGDPKPTIEWLKNEQRLPKHIILGRKKNGGSKLQLNNANKDDSGQYTCVAINDLGYANTSFTIEVIEPIPLNPAPPEVRDLYPLNQTVEYGGDATFHCRVKSETYPNIQWLKRVDKGPIPKVNIKVDGHVYSIIKIPYRPILENGFYVKNLTINRVDFEDEGVYLCLTGNMNGTHSRSSFLTVRPRVLLDQVAEKKETYMITLIAVALTFGLILLVIFVVCLMRYQQKPEWTSSKYPPPSQKTLPHPPLLESETGFASSSWVSDPEFRHMRSVCIHNGHMRGDLC